MGKETKEEMGKKRGREEENEENETGSVQKSCVGSFSAEAFDIFQSRVRSGELWWSFLGGPFGEA